MHIRTMMMRLAFRELFGYYDLHQERLEDYGLEGVGYVRGSAGWLRDLALVVYQCWQEPQEGGIDVDMNWEANVKWSYWASGLVIFGRVDQISGRFPFVLIGTKSLFPRRKGTCCKQGHLFARKVRRLALSCPDVVPYTATISGLAKCGREIEALEVFFEMRCLGQSEFNEYSFVATWFQD
ncbi:hypothetical protein LguiA_026495 [Lonicera macranthoides]